MAELAEIFQKYGSEYLSEYQDKMLPSHLKAIKAIQKCRTPQLGGQVYSCAKCKTQDYSYHSCNNRNCPKCGGDKIQHWIKKQFDLLLPTPYFFVTFTLPEEFRLIVRSNQKYFYKLFFKTSAQALKILAREKRFVGGNIGFLGIIQSWARNLIYHPHIHYIVPGVALSDDNKKYIKIKNQKFLVHVKPLSLLFRRLFKEGLQSAGFYNQVPAYVWRKDWVVHVKSAGYGQEIIKYIAPYVYRIALSNNKIKKITGQKITFEYEDSETKKTQDCTLDVLEFMRRYLQHVLPSGFTKVRYFGIMGANKKDSWFLLKNLLFQALAEINKTRFLNIEHSIQNKKKNHCCRSCGGDLILIGIFKRGP